MADEFNVVMEKSSTDAPGFTRFEHATVGLFYSLFCIMGATSNLLTALTLYKDTKLFSKSKPWLHILLALTNIGVVAPSPFPASSSFSGKWLYGGTMCQVYAFEGMFVGVAAITTVIFLCIERYCVSHQRLGADTSGGPFHVMSLLLIVGNGLFWATMPLLGWTRYAVELTGTSCALDWSNPDEGFISYIVALELFSFGFPVCLAVFCLCYTTSQASTGGDSREESVHASSQAVEQAHAGFSEDQLTTLCYVFLALVLVGWSPFAFLCTYTMFFGAHGLSMLAASIPPLACKVTVSAYPLAYAIFSPRFRHSLLSLFSGHSADRKQD